MGHAVPKLWAGQTVVCIATGPSLTAADVEYCRGKAPVIVVNDAWRLAQWADVLCCIDRPWWRHYKGVPEFAGMKYAIGSAQGKRNPIDQLTGIQMLRNGGYEPFAASPDTLAHCKNSGHAAINLAVHFGASRIVLLGYDMSFDLGKAHFFGDHPSGLNQGLGESQFPGFRRSMARLAVQLEALGVTVINCSRRTSLDCFQTMPLEEALAPQLEAVS